MPALFSLPDLGPGFQQRCRKYIRRFVWEPLARLSQVIPPLPLLAGLAMFCLFAFVGQMKELYLAYLGPDHARYFYYHILFAALTLTLFSEAIFQAHYLLSNVQIEVQWSADRDLASDSWMRLARNVAGLAAASLPWAGVIVGLGGLKTLIARNVKGLEKLSSFPEAANAEASFKSILHLIPLTQFLIGVTAAAALIAVFQIRKLKWIRYGLYLLIFAALCFSIFEPFIASRSRETAASTVALFRSAGPIAMVTIAALFIFTLVAAFALLTRQVGLPLFIPAAGLIAIISSGWLTPHSASRILLVFLLAVVVMAVLSKRRALAGLAGFLAFFSFVYGLHLKTPRASAVNASSNTLDQALAVWLNARRPAILAYKQARPEGKYPVFIVAAEGGGIYAAAAASSFLAKLQDRCPGFASHVFAISGVSGGSIGSAVFQSLQRERQLDRSVLEGDCVPRGAPDSLFDRTSAVIQDDHLSPLLGHFIADVIGLHYDRAQGLENSFICSLNANLRSPSADCGSGPKDGLRRPYNAHWDPQKPAPALVLNTTSVETGLRFAFAPFRVGHETGNTFRSFSDAAETNAVNSATLADAAFASARFPGILPAYVIAQPDKRKVWNFVDGGYADSSGASEALEMFQIATAAIDKLSAELSETPGQGAFKDMVEPRLILLTSDRPKLLLSDTEGTPARDTLAPLITLLNVRGLLSEQAITRTVAETAGGEERALALNSKKSAAQTGNEAWRTTLISLDEQDFNLSLGWTISKPTYDLVALQAGLPGTCEKLMAREAEIAGAREKTSAAAPRPDPSQLSRKGRNDDRNTPDLSLPTIRANSCVMDSIVKLLTLNSSTGAAPAIPPS